MTLIEVLISIAILSLILISGFTVLWSLQDSHHQAQEIMTRESLGFATIREIEWKLSESGSISKDDISTREFLENFSITTINNIATISFTIDDHEFFLKKRY